MAWGHLAYRKRASIAQKYPSGAMRYKHPIMAQSEAQQVLLAEPQSGRGGLAACMRFLWVRLVFCLGDWGIHDELGQFCLGDEYGLASVVEW
jgi:hypothetical protein